MARESLLQVENLTLQYPGAGRKIFNGINFSIAKNKVTLLLGPSGCGKSSLVSVLTGLIPHSVAAEVTGAIWYQGKNILGQRPEILGTKLGMILQDPESQFCTFTVEDELAFGLENHCVPREEMGKKIDWALELLKIAHLRKKPLNNLSGGEKQRVAIASILALDPDCLIFDEPTANLDPLGTLEIFEIIKELKSIPKTLLIIEHKLEELIQLVDEVVMLTTEGGLIAGGSALQFIQEMLAREEEERLWDWAPKLSILSKQLNRLGFPGQSFHHEAGAAAEMAKHLDWFGQNLAQGQQGGEAILQEKPPAIELEGLSFAYQRQEVLKDLTMTVAPGDFVALLGSNGAGKSTLAKILLGLLPDYEGQVFIDGRELKQYRSQELMRKIGLVFQNPEHQFVANSVSEELAYTLKVRGVDSGQIATRVEQYLENFRLTNTAKMNPFLLSQGEKRRLSVASMLIGGQEILLLDEPTFGQDSGNTRELMEYMQKINREGVTVIIITHDMELVARYCRRAVVLDGGQNAYDGPVKEMFAREEILEKAKLAAPVLYRVCQKIRQHKPDFPLFMHNEQLLAALAKN